MTAQEHIVGKAIVSVDYVTGYQHDRFCIFTITIGTSSTVYCVGIPAEIFKGLNKEELPRYLIENIRNATLVRSFNGVSNGLD